MLHPLRQVFAVFVLSLAATVLTAGARPAEAASSTQAEITISSRTEALPERVKATHMHILEAARSGDIDMLLPVLEMNELKPTVSFGASEDPIAYWKRTSGDGDGRQIMAIMAEILEMPHARVNAGRDDEMYVWPYLAEISLDKLAPAQLVDLYRLVTPEEVKAMKDFGGYIHYRLGIGPDGTWHYFVAGD